MAVKKGARLLVEAGINEEEECDAQRPARFILPEFAHDRPYHDSTEPAPDQCKGLPIDRNLGEDVGGDLVQPAPDRTIIRKVLRQRLRTQFIADPGYRQIVPIKAQLRNQKSVCEYGSYK